MDTLLIIIAILGMGALFIALYVFAMAAKRYVTGEDLRAEMQALESDLSPYRHWVDRDRPDRRTHKGAVVFPITVNGVLIREDRRQGERRRVA
jgi:hypothetical protein